MIAPLSIVAYHSGIPIGYAGVVSSSFTLEQESTPSVLNAGQGAGNRQDSVEVSAHYRSVALSSGEHGSVSQDTEKTDETPKEWSKRNSTAKKADGQELSEGEQKQIEQLKSRDREVRAHEQAHKSAAGGYAGAVSYEYQMGPDGQRYAVGGEVSIDTSKERDPEATIAKMKIVQAAALAPAEPSGQDRAVAAVAAKTEMQARQEIVEQSNEGMGKATADSSSGTSRNKPTNDDSNTPEIFVPLGPGRAANPWTRDRSAASRLDVVA